MRMRKGEDSMICVRQMKSSMVVAIMWKGIIQGALSTGANGREQMILRPEILILRYTSVTLV
jgi:hypothetical protein